VEEIAETILAEGHALLEQEGSELGPAEGVNWSRIYKVTMADTDSGVELRTEKGESVYVFIAVMVKGGKFSQWWLAFLCSEQNSEYLFADRVAYDSIGRTVLKAEDTRRWGGAN
jgi:hypothetical protein